jgi:hypothetical protein
MSNPLVYLVRMVLFLIVVCGLAFVLRHDLLRVFMNTPILNGVILGVLLLGIVVVIRQVISLVPEVKWLQRFRLRRDQDPPPPSDTINMLAPLATMLGEKRRLSLSTASPPASTSGASSRAT